MSQFPLIIGHRGCKYFGIRENSREAVEQSIREKVDIVELDVVYTTDGCFIGYHPKLFRTKPLSIAHNVDILESLLNILNNRAILYIDVKEKFSQEKMDLLFKLIKNYYNKQAIIGSYYLSVLSYFRRIAPNWIINYHCLATRKSIKNALDVGANWINPVSYGVTAKFVSEAKQKGLKFVPTGNENYSKQLRYAKLGAYALSTFKPAFFREWLQSRF